MTTILLTSAALIGYSFAAGTAIRALGNRHLASIPSPSRADTLTTRVVVGLVAVLAAVAAAAVTVNLLA